MAMAFPPSGGIMTAMATWISMSAMILKMRTAFTATTEMDRFTNVILDRMKHTTWQSMGFRFGGCQQRRVAGSVLCRHVGDDAL